MFSPLLGFALGMLLMVAVAWIFCAHARRAEVDRWFRRCQLVSAALYSLGHGGNDAQKTMGIIAMLLFAAGHERRRRSTCRCGWCSRARRRWRWARSFGGWRIVKTMGMKITKLKPVGGFCAETGGAITLFLATGLGIPVSTTHTITGAIIGVGADAQALGRALGRGRAHRLGLGADDPVQRVHFSRSRGGSRTACCSAMTSRIPFPALVAFALRVAARMQAIGLARTAASLSFTTLLALVPLATVALSLRRALSGVRAMARHARALPAEAHAARQRRHAVIHQYIREFTEKAASLTGISIVFIAAHRARWPTATIEREINAIWGIDAPPLAPRRLVVYALGLTLGPVLVGASLSLTTVARHAVARGGAVARS